MSNFVTFEYQDADETLILGKREDGTTRLIEQTHSDLWSIITSGALGPVRPFVPPLEPSPEDILERERAAMKCSSAQLGLALIDMGLLEIAEKAINASDRARIVWTKAGRIQRNGILTDALSDVLSDTQIDDAFRLAANLSI